MGDLAEIRGFIVAITFLGFFATLLAFAPADLLASDEADTSYRNINVPEYLDAPEVVYFAETVTYQLNDSLGDLFYDHRAYLFTLGRWDFDLIWQYPSDDSDGFVRFEHAERLWGFGPITSSHPMTFCSSSGVDYGTSVDAYDLMDNYNEERKYAKFTVSCEHTQMTVFFSYNTTEYSSIRSAFENKALYVTCGMELDDTNTGFNAWDLLSMILFFQLPNVHPLINFIIAIPLYACIAYLIFIFVTKVIPLIGGG